MRDDVSSYQRVITSSVGSVQKVVPSVIKIGDPNSNIYYAHSGEQQHAVRARKVLQQQLIMQSVTLIMHHLGATARSMELHLVGEEQANAQKLGLHTLPLD